MTPPTNISTPPSSTPAMHDLRPDVDPHDPLAAWILDARADVDHLASRTLNEDARLGDQMRATMGRAARRTLAASLLMGVAGLGCAAPVLFAVFASVANLAHGGSYPAAQRLLAFLSNIDDAFLNVYHAMTFGLGILLIPGAFLIRSRGPFRQLLGIASAWMVLGLVLVSYPVAAIVLGMNTSILAALGVPVALALLLRGTPTPAALDRAREFQPAAFRGVLLLSLVMAVADALVLGGAAVFGGTLALARLVAHLFGEVYVRYLSIDWVFQYVLIPGAASAAMFLCARGLLRLKIWALLAAVAMNWVVMFGCLYEVIDVGFGALLLAFTSIIQLFLPVPVLAAMIRGRVVPRPRLERLMPRLLRGTLVAATLWLVLDVVRAAL